MNRNSPVCIGVKKIRGKPDIIGKPVEIKAVKAIKQGSALHAQDILQGVPTGLNYFE